MRTFTMCWIVLMLIASLSGCTQTRTVLYDKTLRPAKPKTYHIAIYDASSIQRPYKVIGIAISSAGPFHRVLDAINNLQDEARKMGGDALIDLSKGAPTSLEMQTSWEAILGSSEDILNPKVIVWE